MTEIKITVNKDHYEHIAIRTSEMFYWLLMNINQHSTSLTKQKEFKLMLLNDALS